MIILESERFLFRQLEADDFDALFELYRGPEMRSYFPKAR